MILVLGHLNLRAGGTERLLAALHGHTRVVRAINGCLHYAVAPALGDPDRLIVGERWRDRAAQSLHLVGDHMPAFNVAMQRATVIDGTLDAYENGRVRKMLEVPAKRFRGEYEDADMVIVMGTVKFAGGEIDRVMPDIEAMLAASRAEDGCDLYAYSRDVLDGDLMHVSERWRDRATLERHFATPHMATFNAVFGAAKIVAMTVKAYDVDGERVLLSR